MIWKKKTVMVGTLASAIALLAVACGSDSETGPSASIGTTPEPTSTAPPPTSTPVPTPDDVSLPGIDVGEPNGVVNYDDLVDALEAAGVDMAASDMAFPPSLFDVSGRAIEVGGVQDSAVPAVVFEFESSEARFQAQAEIQEPRSDTAASLDDFDRLALFGTGNLIVMYIGNNADTIDLLGSILGRPFTSKSDTDDVVGGVDEPVLLRRLVNAPIESVDLVIMESDPVQITATIVAGLPNGCAEPGGTVSHIAGNVYGVTVSNSVPGADDIICTDDYRVYEENVRLGSREVGAEFMSGVTYTLVVNDKTLEFTVNGVVNQEATLSGYDGVMLALARQDAIPQATDETVGGVFGIEAGIIKLGNQDVQVHEFETVALADGAASGVTSDGGTIKMSDGSVASVRWIAPPHFFQRGNAIVLYVGDDATVLSTLVGALGTSFAGSQIDAAKPLPEPTPTPGGGLAPFPIPTQPAPIESVEVAFLESFPVQHMLQIVAGLENSCIEPYGSQAVSTAGVDGNNTVTVEVTNVVSPPGTVCAEIYRTYEENINLGSGFEPGSEWDVFVNGELIISFTAQ